jgi:putative FmdB family regulatory protein
MPVYTYRCESCGIQFDYQQSFNAANLTVCPECEEESLHRVYRPVGIVFKGSGFYATDNRSPSGQQSERGSKEESAPKTEKTETKSEEKKSGEPAKKENQKADA